MKIAMALTTPTLLDTEEQVVDQTIGLRSVGSPTTDGDRTIVINTTR